MRCDYNIEFNTRIECRWNKKSPATTVNRGCSLSSRNTYIHIRTYILWYNVWYAVAMFCLTRLNVEIACTAESESLFGVTVIATSGRPTKMQYIDDTMWYRHRICERIYIDIGIHCSRRHGTFDFYFFLVSLTSIVCVFSRLLSLFNLNSW